MKAASRRFYFSSTRPVLCRVKKNVPRSALANIIQNGKGIKLKELTSTKLTFISKEVSDPLAGEGPAEASAGPHPRRGAAAAGLERGGRRRRGRGRRYSARSVRGGGCAGGGRAA